MTLPDAHELDRQQAASDLSWSTITAAQVRQKVADIATVPNLAIRESCQRMLAYAVTTHAPHHAGLLPPEWLEPEVPRR